MQFHNLKRNTANRKAKQVGRGGTRGKTSGRGTKGQNARAGRKKRPEMRDIIKRLPKLRGRGKNSLKSRFAEMAPIKLNTIEANFAVGEVVSPQTLVEKKLLKSKNGKNPMVKILGVGKLSKAITFDQVKVSMGAKKIIEAAKGKINNG
jgi:large subunit ribosomal protein L15